MFLYSKVPGPLYIVKVCFLRNLWVIGSWSPFPLVGGLMLIVIWLSLGKELRL